MCVAILVIGLDSRRPRTRAANETGRLIIEDESTVTFLVVVSWLWMGGAEGDKEDDDRLGDAGIHVDLHPRAAKMKKRTESPLSCKG